MDRDAASLLRVALNNDGTTWVELGGTVAIEHSLQEEFSVFRGAKRARHEGASGFEPREVTDVSGLIAGQMS
jgi:hypothetical protein